MQMLFVTIRGPHRSIDLELPGDVPINELLPTLLFLCGTPDSSVIQTDVYAWRLSIDGAAGILAVSGSLLDGNVVDGTILRLHNRSEGGISRQKEKFVPRTIQPATIGDMGIRWSKDGLLKE